MCVDIFFNDLAIVKLLLLVFTFTFILIKRM